jgi:hypothetical protein
LFVSFSEKLKATERSNESMMLLLAEKVQMGDQEAAADLDAMDSPEERYIKVCMHSAQK